MDNLKKLKLFMEHFGIEQNPANNTVIYEAFQPYISLLH